MLKCALKINLERRKNRVFPSLTRRGATTLHSVVYILELPWRIVPSRVSFFAHILGARWFGAYSTIALYCVPMRINMDIGNHVPVPLTKYLLENKIFNLPFSFTNIWPLNSWWNSMTSSAFLKSMYAREKVLLLTLLSTIDWKWAHNQVIIGE